MGSKVQGSNKAGVDPRRPPEDFASSELTAGELQVSVLLFAAGLTDRSCWDGWGGRWVQTIDGRYICRNLYVILCILYIYIYTYIYYSYSYLCVWFKPILDLIQKTTSSLYHGGISWTSSVISIHFMSSVLPRWYVIVTPNIKNTHACIYIHIILWFYIYIYIIAFD